MLHAKFAKNGKILNCIRDYLLRISFRVRQFSGHVEHDLFIVEVAVDRFGSRLTVCHIQTATKTEKSKKS